MSIAGKNFRYPLSGGRYLIEASAGTGKTYTIAELYLRLLLEREMKPSEILVVTFSKAATEELKSRLLSKLTDAAAEAFSEGDGRPTRRQLLLQLAIASFDEARIYTIHGFCQRMLQDFAADAGLRFEQTLIPDEKDCRIKVFREFWRRNFYGSENLPPDTYDQLMNIAKISSSSKEKQIYFNPEDSRQTARVSLLKDLPEALRREKEKEDVLSFDDLTHRLADALRGPNGSSLAAGIRSRFRAVFVDEFQDTDEAQYAIFDRVFPMDSDVVFYMIGDPKQAIYSFRGADVYTYLKAKNQLPTDHRFTLTENFRSSPPMIAAVDGVFSGRPEMPGPEAAGSEIQNAFLEDGIPFVTVFSGRPPESFYYSEAGRMCSDALRLVTMEGPKTKTEPKIAYFIVNEIVSLLSAARDARTGPEKRRLKPSDIAILVNTNVQSARYQDLLRKKGVNASAAAKNTVVYNTLEANELAILLNAILHASPDAVRRALATPFFRRPPEEIDAFANRPDAQSRLEQWIFHFSALETIWRRHGFLRMFFALLEQTPPEGDPPGLVVLCHAEGERNRTNFIHLAELLSNEQTEELLPPERLLEYLLSAMAGAYSQDEGDAEGTSTNDPNALQLRLERDSDAVQILTMFGAKGLQFPVVFLPSPIGEPADKKRRDDPCMRFRTREGETFLFDESDAPEAVSLRRKWMEENLKTKLRLIYVALTRSRDLCYLFRSALPEKGGSAQAGNLDKSALGLLLLSPDVENRTEKILSLSKYPLPSSDFAPWAAGRHPNVGILSPESAEGAVLPVPERNATSVLTLRTLPFVERSWRVMSYSSFGYEGIEEDLPPVDVDDSVPEESPENVFVGEETFHAFPAGKSAGIFFHELIAKLAKGTDFRRTHLDFTSIGNPEQETVFEDFLNSAVRNSIFSSGSDSELRSKQLSDAFRRVLTTKLPELGKDLSEIRPETCAAELEFHLAATRSLNLTKILSHLRETASKEIRMLVAASASGPDPMIHGMLDGFMDLVFESGGKYYIVDWKTNRLGRSDSDYRSESVRATMASSGYLLQYHLYAMALQLLLKKRRPEMDFDEKFGGVFYLFPRGMGRKDNGIWFDRPPAACLNGLLRIFQGTEVVHP